MGPNDILYATAAANSTRPPLRTRRRGRRTTGDRDAKSKPFVWTKTADEILAKVAGFVSESLIRDTRHASYNPSVSRDLGDYSTKTSHLWSFGAQAEVSTPSAIPQPWGRTPQLLDPIRTEVRHARRVRWATGRTGRSGSRHRFVFRPGRGSGLAELANGSRHHETGPQ